MDIFIGPRQSGRTIRLIRESSKCGSIIVAPTLRMAYYIEKTAKELGISIPKPISVGEFIQRASRKEQYASFLNEYLIDDLEYCLRQFNVRAFSICSEANDMHYLFKK